MKSMQYASSGPTGRGQVANRGVNEPAEAATFDPLIGRKVRTRWPDDNNFYEAVITDYNPVEVYLLRYEGIQYPAGLAADITFFFFFSFKSFHVRDGMLWYTIWVQQMRHGNGLIFQR